jgi:hypothetical protein
VSGLGSGWAGRTGREGIDNGGRGWWKNKEGAGHRDADYNLGRRTKNYKRYNKCPHRGLTAI